MNRARSDRRLGSMDETTHKRLKTVDTTQQESGTEVAYWFSEKTDQNCPPTPPLSQHFSLNEKYLFMLA